MTSKSQQLGEKGERLAEQYLRSRGYQVVRANFRKRFGEIDLVAQKGGELIFVEVKSRRSTFFGGPLEGITEIKLHRIIKVALTYVREYNWGGPFRIDVIGITWNARDGPQIEHLKNVNS
jgi:putative endonuclease